MAVDPLPPLTRPREDSAAQSWLAALDEGLAGCELPEPMTLRQWVQVAERWRILSALRECRGNRSQAARRLGIGRRTLYSKMERLGIASSHSLTAGGT